MAFIVGGVIGIMILSFFATILGFIAGIISHLFNKGGGTNSINRVWIFTTAVIFMVIITSFLSSF